MVGVASGPASSSRLSEPIIVGDSSSASSNETVELDSLWQRVDQANWIVGLRVNNITSRLVSGAGTEPGCQGSQMTPRNLPGGQTWYFDPQIFRQEVFSVNNSGSKGSRKNSKIVRMHLPLLYIYSC